VQVLHWMQVNQLTDQLTIINRQIAGGLLTGFALCLVLLMNLDSPFTYLFIRWFWKTSFGSEWQDVIPVSQPATVLDQSLWKTQRKPGKLASYSLF